MKNVPMKESVESKIDDYTNSVKKGIPCFEKSYFDV